MKIEIYLRFRTMPGQYLFLGGEICALIGYGEEHVLPLAFINEDFWRIELSLSSASAPVPASFGYYFLFNDGTGQIVRDSKKGRKIYRTWLDRDFTIIDTWNDMSAVEHVFLTSPFQHTFLSNARKVSRPGPLRKKFRFSAKAPLLQGDECLALTGNHEALGNWLLGKPVQMKFDGDTWFADVDEQLLDLDLEYKYVVVSADGHTWRYEEGNNRNLMHCTEVAEKIFVNDGFARLGYPSWRGTGIAIPVFSIRTRESFGVGEFKDIIPLVDWAKKVSIKMIQLLPVNDTTATHTFLDSYPYAAISAFALHPLYIRLEDVAEKKQVGLIASFIEKGQTLNTGAEVDYEEVMELKLKALRKIYEADGGAFLNKQEFKVFHKNNRDWLVPYGIYCYLRDKHGTADTLAWGEDTSYNDRLTKRLLRSGSKSRKEVEFHFFIQYHLHCQLKQAHDYANANGVILKGDIAIGVHRYGADTWTQPELFHLNRQAGAPPDDFAEKGQNWGFPTYNWENMHLDHYQWWKRRFNHMSNYFDAFRIDHILGFFRIWSIPAHAVEGIMGRFVPAIPLTVEEFLQKGISFCDIRFCRPYITDTVLWELAGDLVHDVKHFLTTEPDGTYTFKKEFVTQKLIEAYFSRCPMNENNMRLKQVLFDLQSNVVLWEEEEGKYHFRFNVFNTSSFNHLDEHTRRMLIEMYNDYFFHRQDRLWKHEAMEKLPSLKSFTDMLICGEDLGLIPHSVPEVMKALGILSMEVQRMPKQFHTLFFEPCTSPYLSVVTPSTHDMSTIREWWMEDRGRSQVFYNEQLGLLGDAPAECTTEISKRIVEQHLASPAMWAVFQLQDLFSINHSFTQHPPFTERINIPGDPNHYWRYRMPFPVESLLENANFNAELYGMINNCGR